jgi:hypothetical protein
MDGHPGNVHSKGFGAIQGGPWITWMVQVDLMDHNRMIEIEYLEDRESFAASWP